MYIIFDEDWQIEGIVSHKENLSKILGAKYDISFNELQEDYYGNGYFYQDPNFMLRIVDISNAEILDKDFVKENKNEGSDNRI